MTYNQFEIVRVPFPFTDRTATKNRPALVLSRKETFGEAAEHSVLAMITSKSHSPWPLDLAIYDLTAAGLSVPSVIRWKLFTLDHRLIRGVLGSLSSTDSKAVQATLTQVFF